MQLEYVQIDGKLYHVTCLEIVDPDTIAPEDKCSGCEGDLLAKPDPDDTDETKENEE